MPLPLLFPGDDQEILLPTLALSNDRLAALHANNGDSRRSFLDFMLRDILDEDYRRYGVFSKMRCHSANHEPTRSRTDALLSSTECNSATASSKNPS